MSRSELRNLECSWPKQTLRSQSRPEGGCESTRLQLLRADLNALPGGGRTPAKSPVDPPTLSPSAAARPVQLPFAEQSPKVFRGEAALLERQVTLCGRSETKSVTGGGTGCRGESPTIITIPDHPESSVRTKDAARWLGT